MSEVSGCLRLVVVGDRVPPPVSQCDRAQPYRLGGLLPYALGGRDRHASDPNLALRYPARRLPQHPAPHRRQHPCQSSVAPLGRAATDGDLKLREYLILVRGASR